MCKTLKIDSKPQGAIVRIKDKSLDVMPWKTVGITPFMIRKTIESCTKANVDILVQSPGYKSVKKLDVQLSDDPNASLPTIELTLTDPRINKPVSCCIDDSDMVWVTSGTVKMELVDGKKKTTVESEVSGFWISQYEITEQQFQTFLKETGTKDTRRGKSWVDPLTSGNLPAVRVTYDLAVKYCDWVGGRLPTEAEWMRAARGDQHWTYPWGNDFKGNECNYKIVNQKGVDDPNRGLMSVGSFKNFPSPFGCYDMAGNVMEIVTSDSNSNGYVYKGGYCDCNKAKEETKATYRKQPDKNDTIQWCGFRVVKTSDP